MKKLIITLLIIISLIIILIIGIPVLFKSTILEKTKTTINRQVNANVEFSGLKISILKSFPKVSLMLNNIVVSGIQGFQNDTLLKIPSMETNVSLFSLFGKNGIAIQKIILDKPELLLKVNKEGKANWDIAKMEENAEEISSVGSNQNGEDEEFVILLDEVIINNADVSYDDRELNFFIEFLDSDFNLNGKMYGTTADIITKGDVGQFSLDYDSIKYISNTTLKANSVVSINYETMDFVLGENELLINKLPIGISGSIAMPDDSIFFDLDFQSKTSGLEDLLALVPPVYSEYLEGIGTSGDASFQGFFKGKYFEEEYPEFDISLAVDNGSFKYTNLPEEIKNIGALLKISKPQGNLGLTLVELKNAHAEVKDNPIDVHFKLKNLLSGIHFDGFLIGKVDFNHLKDAIPMDSLDLVGILDADISVKGTYAAIESGQYGQIISDGSIILSGIAVKDPGLRQSILIPSGKLGFSPREITLSNFFMKIGSSDMNLKGSVTNYLEYIFSNGDLKGDFQLNSNFLNLNELMAIQVETEVKNTEYAGGKHKSKQEGESIESPEEEEVLAFDIPKRMDLRFTSQVKRAVIDRLTITEINGLITVKDKRLNLNGLKMQMLDGQLELTGSYKNSPENTPFFDFGFDIIDFNLPIAYQSLSGFRKMMPFAGKSTGRLSTNFNMKGQLSPSLKIIAPTIDGFGLFKTTNLQIIDSPTFGKIEGILKKEKLKNVAIDDFTANFTVNKGNLLLKQFKTKVAGQDATINGSLSAANLLNMKMDFVIQRDAFGDDIQSILGILPGQERILAVPATVNIKGPVGNPNVSLDLADARKQIMEEIKKSSADDLKKSLDKLGKGLQKLFK